MNLLYHINYNYLLIIDPSELHYLPSTFLWECKESEEGILIGGGMIKVLVEVASVLCKITLYTNITKILNYLQFNSGK